MVTIGLISCGARKAATAVPAQDLYKGQLFQLSRQYVERECDRWFILSAKHGLLSPHALTEPYDMTLNNMGVADRMKWARKVLVQLRPFNSPGFTWVVLAGMKYREFIIPSALGPIRIPLEGLGIGKQLAALNRLLSPTYAKVSDATIGSRSGLIFSPKSDIIIGSDTVEPGVRRATETPARRQIMTINKALQNAITRVETELMTFKGAEEILGRSAFSLRMKAKKEGSGIEVVDLFGRILIPVKEVDRLKEVFEAQDEVRAEKAEKKVTAKEKKEGYPGMSNAELRALCVERGIKKGGTKPALVERLDLYDADPDAFAKPDEDEDEVQADPPAKKAGPKKPRKPKPKADPEPEEDEEEIPSLDDLLGE